MSKRNRIGQHALARLASAPVTLHSLGPVAPNGSLQVQVRIDYSRVEVPDRSYYADYCDVPAARAGISLIFGKLEPGSGRLRTKVEIAFPDDLFRNQLWNALNSLDQHLRSAPGTKPLPPVSNLEDTDKVQTFRSNNVFVSYWGEDITFDFYYLSPKRSSSGAPTEAALDPVIRIVLVAPVCMELIEKCRFMAVRAPFA
jgi:hypothetical protein